MITLDGKYNTYRLQQEMDFAKRHDKTLRLDALIFYVDTPNWVYILKYNQKNHDYIYKYILTYTYNVVTTVKAFNTHNNINITEIITLLNEPINLFLGPFEACYNLRSNVHQHLPILIKTWLKDDNDASE